MALMFKSVLQSGGGAELVVTCDSEFAGATISCSDGTTTLNKTCPVSSPYEVTFKIPNSGDWTISATVSGTTYSSDPISVDLDYETDLEFGFNWKRWVDTAQYLDSTDYSTLSDLLADEEAVRELCLEHACVDYLCTSVVVNPVLTEVIGSDLFAKWVNDSDYALDKMYANAAIKTVMDTAGKYGYGEWVITDDTTTPPTWGAKGNVPIMTSNSAPYGECVKSSIYNATYDAYKAFDDSPTTSWASTAGTNARIGYKFANPVNVRRIKIKGHAGVTPQPTCQVQYSDDGTTWQNAGNTFAITGDVQEVDISDYGYHLYWCAYQTSTSSSETYNTFVLQFYGRELSVSVPKMTGNTTPYGIASASAEYNPAWKAFDSDPNTFWQATSTAASGAWLEYGFLNDTMLKMIVLSGLGSREFKVQGYIDNEWTDITSNYTVGSSDKDFVYITSINQSKPCKRFRYYGVNVKNHGAYSLQFFGKDYSEKEFEQGSTKKWLYDHGVELETIEIFDSNNNGTTTKRSDSILINTSGSGYHGLRVQMDVGSYDLIRVAYGLENLLSAACLVGVNKTTAPSSGADWTAYRIISSSDFKNNGYCDISSVDDEEYVVVGRHSGSSYTDKLDVTELWLE